MKGERNTFGVLLLNSHNHFDHATEKVKMENVLRSSIKSRKEKSMNKVLNQLRWIPCGN